jgi:hypothetical protein
MRNADLDADIKDSLIIIFEFHLNDRYQELIRILNSDSINLELSNVFGKNLLDLCINRINYRKTLKAAEKKMLNAVGSKKFIFVSNAEGYIAQNLIASLNRNTNVQVINLQHGLFQMHKKKYYKVFIKNIINFITNKLFHISIIGLGFGSKLGDKYIVYSEEYKKFLVESGWDEKNVITSSYVLKGFREKDHLVVENECIDCDALLVVQPFSATSQTSVEIEKKLYIKLIETLLKNFNNVYIRQHPFHEVYIPALSSRQFFLRGTDIIDDIKKAGTIISFNSTVLIEYEYTNKKFISVYTKHLEEHESAYFAFKYIYHIDDDHDASFNLQHKQRNRRYFYQNEVYSVAQLFKWLR